MMQLAWHVHHETLCELLVEPIESRMEYIQREKLKIESPRQVVLRLRLLKPVTGPLPLRLKKAMIAINEIRAKLDAFPKGPDKELPKEVLDKIYISRRAWCVTLEVLRNAIDRCQPKLMKLHKKECPNCPWNGTTIFGED